MATADRRSGLDNSWCAPTVQTSACVPEPVIKRQGYFQLGLEVYGGVLLSTWFDRDLSLAGRVAIANEGSVLSELVDFKRAVGVIRALRFISTGTQIMGARSTPTMSYL